MKAGGSDPFHYKSDEASVLEHVFYVCVEVNSLLSTESVSDCNTFSTSAALFLIKGFWYCSCVVSRGRCALAHGACSFLWDVSLFEFQCLLFASS